MMIDTQKILLNVLKNHQDASKWVNSTFEHIKRVSNTKVGEVGQDFIEQLFTELGYSCVFPINKKGVKAKQSPWDVSVKGVNFELKTATEDVGGAFQFNHIRYHRNYDGLICLGISPDNIYFNVWSKADVATGKAGNLVSMEKAGNASYKLTKKPLGLHKIDQFESKIVDFFNTYS